jgi:NAD(P) transhydrogenase subunit alpha
MEQAREVDIIITTALIPGKKAPRLIEEEMVKAMRPGSVIVDLAAEQGGNAAFTQADKVIDVGGVTIIGYTDLTSRLPTHASQFFGTNVYHLLDEMGGAENFRIDHDDEAVRGALVTEKGALMWPPPPPPAKPAPAEKPATRDDLPRFATQEVAVTTPAKDPKAKRKWGPVPGLLIGAIGFGLISLLPEGFVQQFTVFMLACFVGWHLVWEVSPALHTPLMSVTNAISGIIIVGGILQAAAGPFPVQDYLVNTSSMEATIAMALGAVAILVASINVAGGFLVTQRMLQMFRK